jgi:hypothetical protein
MTSENPEKTPASNPRETEAGSKKKLVKGLAFGIGSAAIVAALLFASKSKTKGP